MNGRCDRTDDQDPRRDRAATCGAACRCTTRPGRRRGQAAAKPEWLKVRVKPGRELHGAARTSCASVVSTPSARKPLPQHLRMLGGARGDLPPLRRPVHAPLRLLRRDDGQASCARPRGAGEDRRGRAADGPQVRGGHRSGARRPRRRRLRSLGRDDPMRSGSAMPDCGIEVLIPDFKGRKEHPRDSLATVIEAKPDVLAHNLETVPRLHPAIRPGFGYRVQSRAPAAGRRSCGPTR